LRAAPPSPAPCSLSLSATTQNKPATNNQPAVHFSQNKPAPVIRHQLNEQGAGRATEEEEDENFLGIFWPLEGEV
jgi:hypothetical protein